MENIGRFGKLKIIGLDQGFLKKPLPLISLHIDTLVERKRHF